MNRQDKDAQVEHVFMHWYCLSYIGKDILHGLNANASIYIGYKQKGITLSEIERNKGEAGLKNDAVLISATYLGYMTREQFTGAK